MTLQGPDKIKKFIFKKKRSLGSEIFFDEDRGLKENMGDTLEARFAEENIGLDVLSGDDKKQDQNIEKKVDSKNVNYLFIIALVVILILLGKIIYLQVFNGAYYRELAEGNRIRIHSTKAQRGVFFDRLGRQLVKNIPVFSLHLIPADLPRSEKDQEKIYENLSRIVELDVDKIKEKIKETPIFSYQPIVAKEGVDHQTAILLKIASEELPGVLLETDYRREYIIENDNFLTSLSHVLGYTGKISPDELSLLDKEGYLLTDYLGKYGLENNFEAALRGKYGKKQVEVNALGKESKVVSEIESSAGNNVILTIDLDLQKKAEEVLTEELTKNELYRGSVVILQPQTGEVLALVSLPSFNNNDFSYGISSDKYDELITNPNKPLFNRSISGEYPPGSTLKPIIASAALEEGIINRNTTFNSVGGLAIKTWFFPDWKAGGHGLTNVKKAIAESVNTFFYFIGGGFEDFVGLGVARIRDYASQFGLGQRTGIELPGEASGFLPSKEWKEEVKDERWYVGDTYHLSIGQGDVLVTPLQVAREISVFANSGTLFKPHLVKSVINQQKEIILDVKPEVISSNIVREEHIETIRQGLRQAVISGSARRLSTLPVKVAGKTGTAQWSQEGTPHSWFTCFAPFDEPQLAIAVLVEEGGEGNDVALPVAQKILEWWFAPK